MLPRQLELLQLWRRRVPRLVLLAVKQVHHRLRLLRRRRLSQAEPQPHPVKQAEEVWKL